MSQGGALSSTGSGSAAIETLTGNSGGPVSPDGAFNINLVGDNTTGMDVVGSPGTNTLTIVAAQASTTMKGTVELATNAEAIIGTDTDRAIVPSSLGAKLGTQTAHGVAIGAGTSSALSWTSAGTAGQVLTSNGATLDPTFQAATFTSTWTDASGSFTATANQGYFLTAASTPTLPVTPGQGNIIEFVCDTASAVTITANSGQSIRIGAALSIVAGTAASTARGDSIRLVYRSTGATWFSVGAPEGIWTVT